MTKTPLRALGYVRLSKATDTSTSPERQRRDISRLIGSRGWALVDFVEDIDVSATRRRLDRPGIHELRRRLASGDADVVVVSRLDRIARSVADVSHLLDEGLVIVSASEDFDMSTPTGRAMAQVSQIFAELEARTIAQRVSSSRRHLPTVGRWPGGPTPYGFTTAPSDTGSGRTLLHDPQEAPVVRRMIAEVMEGKPVSRVARDLTSDGLLSRRGMHWTPATVARILRHGSLRGYASVNGDVVRDERGLPSVVWPPYLTAAEGRALDAAIPRQAPESRLGEGTLPLLQGLVLCSSCMRPMVPRHHNHATKAALYTCQTRNRGRECASPQNVTAARVEEEAERQFLAAWSHVPVVETVTVASEPEGLEDVVDAIAETANAFTRPGADIEGLVARMTTLAAERERLAALPRTATEQRATGTTYGDAWAAADTLGRRSLMLSAQAYVIVYPAAVRGLWNADRVVVMDELAGSLDD